MSDAPSPPSDFSGVVRLFPLPNLVFFPHVVQPLHIFEARYRQLMVDALRDDRLITLAVLLPGWDTIYHKTPPIDSIVTVGRIHQEERLEDDRWNLLLQGLFRARVIEELATDKLYRIARVEVLEEIPLESREHENPLREKLEAGLSQRYADQPLALTQLKQLLASTEALGKVCDILAFALPLPIELKRKLLAELDCQRRAELLIREFNPSPGPKKWPPKFSSN